MASRNLHLPRQRQPEVEHGYARTRFIGRATGNTFTDFFNRIRVNRACQLLMETDRLVTHIGYEVEFNNLPNFNRRYLEIKGLTPSEFRRQADHRLGKPTG
jgi:AraC-like DNA-binding protein